MAVHVGSTGTTVPGQPNGGSPPALRLVQQRPAPEQRGSDHRAAVSDRLTTLLAGDGPFADVYGHMLAVPGKRIRAGLLLACARLVPGTTGMPAPDVLDLACAVEMLHEASLVHDDICDSSTDRRGAPSVAARYGVRFAAMAGFHLAGVALRLFADVLEEHPAVRARVRGAPRETTYIHRIGELSQGQIIETLPTGVRADAALRRHYRSVAVAKTGTLFRVACAYGGAVAGCTDQQLRALMAYADHLAVTFQIMDDIRDLEGAPSLGKQAGTDLGRGIPTWPVIEWLAVRPAASARWLPGGAWRPPPGELAALRADVVASGATERAHLVAATEADSAGAALGGFADTDSRRYLADLCRQVLTR